MRKVTKIALVAGGVGVALLGLAVWLAARPTLIQGGAATLGWSECQPEQVEILILGTFHFAQQQGGDILSPELQEQISLVVDQLEEFRPDRVRARDW